MYCNIPNILGWFTMIYTIKNVAGGRDVTEMAKRTHTDSSDINSLVQGVILSSDLHKDAFVTFEVRELSHTFHNFIGLACKEFY